MKFSIYITQIVISLLLMVGCNKNDNQIQPEPPVIEGELISNISTRNIFTSGEIVHIKDSDTSNVKSIRRIVSSSVNEDLITEAASYIFDFKYQPSTFEYEIEIPNVSNEQTLVIKQGDCWVDADDQLIRDNTLTVSLKSFFLKTKAESCLLQIALIKKTKIISSLNLLKNPYNTAPLSAIAKVKAALDIDLQVKVLGQNNNDLISNYKIKKGQESDIPIIGLYNDYDNSVELQFKVGELKYIVQNNIYCNAPLFKELTIETKFDNSFRNKPDELYFATSTVINMSDNSRPTDKPEQNYAVAYDQWGKIRWVSYVGNDIFNRYPIMYKEQLAVAHFYNNKIIVEDFVGKELFTMDYLPDHWLHHELIHLEGEKYATLVGENGIDEYGLIEVDFGTGEYSNLIDFREVITKNRFVTADTWGAGQRDIIHANSIDYSAADNCYVVSARHQGIFKVGRTTHELKWIMTPPINLQDLHPEAQTKVLKAKNFDGQYFENWNIGQHTATILPNGKIMCFDNHNRPFVDDIEAERHSRIVVFEVDEKSLTVSKEWSYATPDKKYSPYMGCAYFLDNSNVLGCWPVYQYAAEVNYGTDKVIWESSFKPANMRGDIYRTYKIKLY